MNAAQQEGFASELRGIISTATARLAELTTPIIARRALLKVIDDLPPPPRSTIEDIAKRFCAEQCVTAADLKALKRARTYSHPRQHFMWVCVKLHGKTVSEVGRFLNRDHTSVIFGVRAHERRMAE